MNVDIVQLIMQALVGVISVVILILGMEIINQLRLRGLDAACGFHARLKVNLTTLKRAARKYNSGGAHPKAHESAFLWLLKAGQLRSLLTSNPNHFDKQLYDYEFIGCVKSLCNLFIDSSGQIPLSKKMSTDLDKLYLLLSDILFCNGNHQFQFNGTYLTSDIDIEDVHKGFDDLVEDIVKEIDKKTEQLLGKLWDSLRDKEQRILGKLQKKLGIQKRS